MQVLFDLPVGQLVTYPLAAFASSARALGFEPTVEGLHNRLVNVTLEWPPQDFESFLHQLRNVLRMVELT
eukprot:4237433-Amphidinium_carterae.1